MFTRRSLIGGGIAGGLAWPWLRVSAETASAGVTDSEIILGMSAAFSGPSRGLGIELYRGAWAYFEHINRAGGISGRRITLKLYDDGYQPDASVNNTMQLMLEDQVFLLFGYVGTPTVTRVLPMLKKFQDENVFLFFPFTGAQPQRQPPYGEFAFNLRASYAQETAGLVENFVQVGRRRIGVFYQVDAYGRSGWAGVRAALARHGERITGEATYRRGTQFTATMRGQVELLQAAEPEAVICIGAYAACAAFARDAVDLGLRVPIANLSFVGSESMLGLLSEGRDPEDAERYTSLLVNSQVVPSYHDTSIPAVREYREFMQRYNPDMPAELVTEAYTPFDYSFVSLEGFLDAKIMVEILRRLDDEPARGDLERAVMTLQDFELGIGERVTFAEDRRQGLQQVYYTVVEDGRFVTLNDWQERFS
ncbi:MAG: ABC transporter substrate-binding protein [Rhodospirillaceae bacterium]|nr:ABC transporter substrate-binding protein [Rhodospirillaceae bacterium]